MPPSFCPVFVTKDHDMFKPIEGNRPLNALHLRRLKKSINDHGFLFMPIVVNEKMEVIDGQHRLHCVKELGLPVYYVVATGSGLNHVLVLYENTKNWNAEDYMNAYADMGRQEYVRYREFRSAYGLDHNVCMGLLSGSTTGKTVQERFKSGDFKVKGYAKACEFAEHLILMEPMYAGWKRWTFVLALMGLVGKDGFALSEFVDKLKLQPTALVDCANVEQYRDLIERIYNHRRREKVNLRY